MSKNCNYSGLRKGPRIRPLSRNLKAIYHVLSKKLLSWGYNVYVMDSIRTRSRYITINTGKGNILKIRLSDHPPGRHSDADFDVYTGEPRKKALDYKELIAVLEKRLKTNKDRLWTDKDQEKVSTSGALNG